MVKFGGLIFGVGHRLKYAFKVDHTNDNMENYFEREKLERDISSDCSKESPNDNLNR